MYRFASTIGATPTLIRMWQWTSATTPPLPSSINSAVLRSLGAGQFSGVYGITGALNHALVDNYEDNLLPFMDGINISKY